MSWINKVHKVLTSITATSAERQSTALELPSKKQRLDGDSLNNPDSIASINIVSRNRFRQLSVFHYFTRFINMGMVLGKISVETPKHEVIHSSADYEIRKYPPAVLAEVTYDPSQFKGNKDGGFTILANYIGALGNPQNTKPEKIAMTAPVVTKSSSGGEKIEMTAPVVTKGGGGAEKKMVTMQFLLPAKYGKAEEAPKPVDERVVIKEEGERKYGVVRFGGVATEKVVEEKVEKLKTSLQRDGYKIIGDFLLARYNPPWTLPAFRTNEVMIPVE